jgi:hypothetical protein
MVVRPNREDNLICLTVKNSNLHEFFWNWYLKPHLRNMKIKKLLSKIGIIDAFFFGRDSYTDSQYRNARELTDKEKNKKPKRTEIINFLLSLQADPTQYLEIGVRNPDHNFNHIKAGKKFSVDPGKEFKVNPVDFQMTSDEFFQKLSTNEVLSNTIRFDVIFIDGLHLAPQVDKDIQNALKYIKEKGFIVLHDCNPPTEWHARESFSYAYTPALRTWNGTTWKAFLKWRSNPLVSACCIDTDWGVGILSIGYSLGERIELTNSFYEFNMLKENRKAYLNLIDFESFKEKLINNTAIL